jgi:hypothetical protein
MEDGSLEIRQRWIGMPWFAKLAITVAVVWLLASVAVFVISFLGDEVEEVGLALMMLT